MELPDARQSQRPVSHHRGAGRDRRRAQLQSLSGQEGTRGPADQCRPQRAEDTEQVREANLAITKASRVGLLALVGSFALSGLAAPAVADQVAREQDIVNLRLGQRLLVDDGSCPPW